MTTAQIPVVFDTETAPPFPLGRYDHTDEDTVIYYDAQGARHTAPYDCVVVVSCAVPTPESVVRDPESWQTVAAEGRRFT